MSTNHIHGKSRGSSLIHSLLPIMPHSQPQRPPLQTRRTETPHPSGCGRGDGYPTVMRDMALAIFAKGNFHNLIFEHLRNNKQFPSLRSTFRWKQQQATAAQSSCHFAIEKATKSRVYTADPSKWRQSISPSCYQRPPSSSNNKHKPPPTQLPSPTFLVLRSMIIPSSRRSRRRIRHLVLQTSAR